MFLLKRLAKFVTILSIILISAVLALYFSMKGDLPSVETLKDLKWQTPMQIYSTDGELISQFGEKKRIPLKLNQIPQQLIDAILASEDERFYLHFGVDPIGMTRAIFGQLTGQNKGGASTITMQVARGFFLSREVTYIRKIREIFISFHIESLLSKDEILELYMNKIELSHRAFGFGAAAQVYYGKDVKDLTLAQIAVLAGLPKAPSTRNPISNPEKAKANRAIVLQRMLDSDFISITEYEAANNAPITGKKHGIEIELNAPYIAEMAHQEMVERYGKEQAYTGGYKVYTSINSHLQRAAQHAVIENLLSYDKRHGYRGAVSSLRPELKPNEQQPELTIKSLDEILLMTSEEISTKLASIARYHPLIPAVVIATGEQTATIEFEDGLQAEIAWSGMSWARAYINDRKQDIAPKLASEILTYGDIIYVEKQTENSYILSQLPAASSALVSLSPDDGAIKAAVGGFSFKQSQFNRVTQAKRQVGSNIKPFIYSAALDNGLTLASLVNDAPINQWDRSSGVVWRPKNSPATYQGPIRVRSALAQSKNVVAVRLLREVGLSKIINHLSSFGFAPDKLPRNESLALGSASLTPLEVATGFATFANGGFLVEPYLIERIEDSFGNIIYQANPKIACDNCLEQDKEQQLNNTLNLTADTDLATTDQIISKPEREQNFPIKQAERAISPQNAFLMTQALNSAIWGADWRIKPFWQGTGFRARSLKRRDIAGKTGTTNEGKDAWFTGFSRRLVATSWIGFDDPSKNLGRSTYNSNLDKNQVSGTEAGAKSAQPAWIKFMATALESYPQETFEQPQDIVFVRIDKATGKLTQQTDNTSLFEYFSVGTEPTEYVTKDSSQEIFEQTATIEEDIF